MSSVWHSIAPERVQPQDFLAVIEIPAGSRKKYELDKQSGCILLDRILHTATHYPANYGFLPRTLGDDGDPLDVLVLCAEALEPLCLVQCRPIGVIVMRDGGRNDEKIIAVPLHDPTYSFYTDISQLPPHILAEMQHFFSVYKALEGRETVVDELRRRPEAERVIRAALAAYRAAFPEPSGPAGR